MGLGRIPAQCDSGFAGADTLSSTHKSTQAHSMHQVEPCQQLPWANYCNHIPTSPKFFAIPDSHKPRAKTIIEILKRLADAYWKPGKQLKTLQNHLETTGNQVKSQRRAAAIALLQVMGYYVDDATGRVGRRLQDGTFRDISIAKLAKYAGLRLKRAQRALKDIIRAGYIKVTKQFIRNEDTGEITNLPSIREFLPKFFIDLDVKGNIWTKWFANRAYKQEREAKKQTKQARTKSRAMMGLIKDGLGSIGAKGKRGMEKVSGIVKRVTGHKPENVELKKRLTQAALDMFNRDPSKSISEYYKELLARASAGG